jgi:hypothetical protein
MPWRELEVAGYTGLELWSFVTDSAEKLRGFTDIIRFVLMPGRFVDHPPRANLDSWDRLCATRRCVALGGVDAHQIGIRIGNRVPLRLMAYRRSFRYLRTHLLADRPLTENLENDREVVYEALRAGRAYIGMDALAPARGFRFWATADQDQTLTIGDEARADAGAWVLHARLPRAARIRLVRDGAELSTLHGRALEHRAQGPGVYRIEAYLHAHGRERTWILSNPIYLR